MYSIRLAQVSDLPRIEAIYAYARLFMEETGNPHQWGKTNPPTVQLIQDIADRRLYVITDHDGIHGVFYFYVGEDPTYCEIYDGAWHHNGVYGTIHRIAGDGSGGILKTAVAYCKQFVSCLRIDTHHDNTVMQKAVAKCGFNRCGIIYIADGTARIAYDLL